MNRTIVGLAVGILLLSLGQAAECASNSGENQKAEGNKGITLEDIARGLKNAEQNIEKEIPKIGSAIGRAVKKITEKDSDKQPPEGSSKDKK